MESDASQGRKDISASGARRLTPSDLASMERATHDLDNRLEAALRDRKPRVRIGSLRLYQVD